MNLARYPAFLEGVDTVQISDDFFWYVTAHQWTSLAADVTPTLTVGDAVNGVLALFTDTTDNNEVAVRSTAELFKFGTNRSIYARGKLQYAENDTNKANVLFGFYSALAADTLANNGAGPRASGSALAVYKVDGETVWRCLSMCNGVQVITASTATAGGAAYQTLEIVCNDFDGVTMRATFKLDGEYLKDSNGAVIRHTVPIASATDMNFGVYAKTGGGAGGETVLVDYVAATQTRV
jgi:hypothetical protein